MTKLNNLEPLNEKTYTPSTGEMLEKQLFRYRYMSPFVMSGLTLLIAKRITNNSIAIVLSCVSVAIIDLLLQGIPREVVFLINKETFKRNHSLI